MTDVLSIVKRFYGEVLKDPATACDSYLADDFVLENYLPERFPFGGRYEGRAGMLQYLQELGGAIEMGPLDMQEWICDGNTVAVRGEEGSLVHATGKRYHMRFVHWLTVNADGRITNMREFNDTAAMGEAF